MKYCKDCQLHYDTDLEKCVFCFEQLEQIEGTTSTYNYTPYKTKPKGPKIVFRLVNYVSLLSILITLFIDLNINNTMTWSLYVISSNVYTMLLLLIIYYQPSWLGKLLLFTLTSIIYVTGIGIISQDYQWSIDYVFPLSIIINQLILTLLVIFVRNRWFEYVVFLLIVSLIGVIPFILNLVNVTEVFWPGYLSGFFSLAVWIGVFFLSSKNTKEELKRRFHI